MYTSTVALNVELVTVLALIWAVFRYIQAVAARLLPLLWRPPTVPLNLMHLSFL